MTTGKTNGPSEWLESLPPVRFSREYQNLRGQITGADVDNQTFVVEYQAADGYAGGTETVPIARLRELNPDVDFGIVEPVNRTEKSPSLFALIRYFAGALRNKL